MITQRILAIDIGIINLGYVLAEIGTDVQVVECNKVDITKIKHNKVPYCECKLHHEFCIPDYIDHFIQEYFHLFDVDIILIERQPIMGITNVQDLLFIKFRNKVKLVSPNSVHKFFKMTKGEYDTRKNESIHLTEEYLSHFKNFDIHERKHDMSDAMLLILHYFKTREVKKESPFTRFQFKEPVSFEQFRFVKPG